MFDYKTGQERSDEFIDDYDKFNYYDYIIQYLFEQIMNKMYKKSKIINYRLILCRL